MVKNSAITLKEFRKFQPISSDKFTMFWNVCNVVMNRVCDNLERIKHPTQDKIDIANNLVSFINIYGSAIRQVGQRQMFIRPCGCTPYGRLVWYVYSYYTCVGVIEIDLNINNEIRFYTTKDKYSPTTSKQKTLLRREWNMHAIYCDTDTNKRCDKIFYLKVIKEAK